MSVILLWQSSAVAYPTSVIFAPTGETLAFGEGAAYAYVPVNFNPSIVAGASWVGLDYGILPVFNYGSGVGFGGFELGVDLSSAATHRDGSEYVKCVFNAKANVLAQTEHVPALGLGLMSFAPFQLDESVNLTYFAATKEFSYDGSSLGTLTLGLGYAMGAKAFAFQGSPPFRDTRWAMLTGYLTPEWKGFSLAIDSVGGISEASASSVALSFEPSETNYLMVGAYFTNDRSLPDAEIYDGLFVTIGVGIPIPQRPSSLP